jgi:hypothetical protein
MFRRNGRLSSYCSFTIYHFTFSFAIVSIRAPVLITLKRADGDMRILMFPERLLHQCHQRLRNAYPDVRV